MQTRLAQPTNGAGQTTLQQAYNNNPATPQILLNAVPNPIEIRASVAGEIWAVLDTAGTRIWEIDSDPDLIVARAGVTIEDSFINGGAPVGLTFSDTFTTGAGFLGGGISSDGTVTYDNSFFIWALLQESKVYRAAAGPGFAAFTLFNALAAIENAGNFDLVQAIILNNGVVHRRVTSGTSTVTQNVGLSNSPQTRASVAGAVMTKSIGDTAVRHAPTYSTVAGSTVNMGTQRGLWCVNPAVALFQPASGVENLAAYIGVDVEAIPFGGNVTKRGIRIALAGATNTRAIETIGTAESDFGGPINLTNDFPNGVLRMGASQDFSMGYVVTNELYMQIATPNVTQWRYSAPGTGRLLMSGPGVILDEFNINVNRFSLGASSGAVGNQVGNFVAGARTVSVGGEWSDFLLTQAANITVDAAMGLVAGWTVNAPSITLGTGTVSTAGVLNVGGNVNQGSVNRFGMRILSNPSGGSGVNAALWLTAGRARFDGPVDINAPIALGGGAAATLGTIGGSGPTAAAQNQWIQVEVNGVTGWIPFWT